MKNGYYEIVPESRKIKNGHELYRIRATQTFSVRGKTIRKGQIGGYVESEANLPVDENPESFYSWIDYDSCVFGNAGVVCGSLVSGSIIYGKVAIGSSLIKNSKISGNVTIVSCEEVTSSEIKGVDGLSIFNSRVSYSKILDYAKVDSSTVVDSIICDEAFVSDCDMMRCQIQNNGYVGQSRLFYVTVADEAAVGYSNVSTSYIHKNARISNVEISGQVIDSSDYSDNKDF